MEKLILNNIETPVIIFNSKDEIIYENAAAIKYLGEGTSLIGSNRYTGIFCESKTVCKFTLTSEEGSVTTDEIFDQKTGNYWRVISKSNRYDGEMYVLQQFISINHQKLYERKLFSNYVFEAETSEFVMDLFDHSLEAEYARASRTKKPFSLVIYAIDNLSELVAEVGNDKTNEYISTIGKLWSDNIRIYDHPPLLIERNLFAVILPHTDKDQAEMVAKKIHSMIKEQTQAKVSMGLASSSDAPSADNLKTLVRRALYVAQQWGGNQIGKG